MSPKIALGIILAIGLSSCAERNPTPIVVQTPAPVVVEAPTRPAPECRIGWHVGQDGGCHLNR
jgi:hypothetical protein